MSQPAEDPPLAAEAEQRLQRLLGSLPALTMPPDVLTRVSAAVAAEAATRAALLGNDAEPSLPPVHLKKHVLAEVEDLEELD
jgi:hypothetical protein